MTPPRVVLESPFTGLTPKVRRENLTYALACLHDSLRRGEAPFASHLLYARVLDDNDAEERRQGINAGLAWIGAADYVVLYEDRGVSNGMKQAIVEAERLGKRIERRRLT